jgi:hypothetical protein
MTLIIRQYTGSGCQSQSIISPLQRRYLPRRRRYSDSLTFTADRRRGRVYLESSRALAAQVSTSVHIPVYTLFK